MYDRNVFYSMDFLQILWLWSTGDDKLLKAKKNQQRLKGWTWWQIKHGYNGNFDQRFICGCKHYLIIVGVISFEVYIKKKVNMKSVVSSVNIPVTVIVSQIGVLNARLGYFTISGMASAGHKYQLRFFNLTKSSLW